MHVPLFLTMLLLLPNHGLGQDSSLAEHEPAGVTGVNNNGLDAHMYVSRANGARMSLGVVESFTRRDLTLPTAFIEEGSEFRVIAEPIGSRVNHVSPPMLSSAGGGVLIELAPSLSLSSASLRSRR